MVESKTSRVVGLTSDPGAKQSVDEDLGQRTKARIIIPVWGAKYVARLDAACLPALLAPGNLPHLAKHFDCELVIVTESVMFETVKALAGVRSALRHCELKLVAIDDALSHQQFYGLTVTHALYRGFVDLGERAKDVWCLFLNADFILADGSYRALVTRMLAGERCILAPSYCVIEERARPMLNAWTVDGQGVLAMPPREMAGLILDHRHFTIRAKTINSRMFRIDHVDQFYYLHDNNTLLGRQIPIAVVAFRPERVPVEPVAFWDYGVLSEVCPTSELCVLGDSDDFLMLELRGQRTMAGWLKLGWMDKDEIAGSLSRWMTKDQRRCADFPLRLHRSDLPLTLADGEKVLDRYVRDVMSRLSAGPHDHRDHYIWRGAIELHDEWHRKRATVLPDSSASDVGGDDRSDQDAKGEKSFGALLFDLVRAVALAPFGRGAGGVYLGLFNVMRAAYLKLVGRAPDVGAFHPYRADLSAVLERMEQIGKGCNRALAVWSVPGASVAPHTGRWFREVVDASPEDILSDVGFEALRAQGPFDACFLELDRGELVAFEKLHLQLRTLIPAGGRILVFCQTRGLEQIGERDFQVIAGALPEQDIGELRFQGGFTLYMAQRAWEAARRRADSGRTWDLVRLAVVTSVLSPLVWFANGASMRRAPGRFPGFCTSLILEVTIV